MNGKCGLYDPADEKDSCGVGMVVNIGGAKDHRIVEYGLRILENLAHRGAENADGRTGDGSGITLQIPHEYILKCGIKVPEAGRYGTGIVFLPHGKRKAEADMCVLREDCGILGLSVIGERKVPVDHSVPGPLALETEPTIVQVFISSYDGQETLERKLFQLRKMVERDVSDPEFYVCSLSTRTIVYKGMLTPEQIRHYYLDLSDPDFVSAIAMVHSRFSTNTVPMWKLAQPFRMLCHNGEINTIKGNRSWMEARESILRSPVFPDISAVSPIVQPGMSDSASLDNVFEFLTLSGLSMSNAISAMIPESWNSKNPIPDSLKAYYEYNSILMEPWDGPAAVLFTDGRFAGGLLDRNGLRPARYTVTADGLFILASEAGVIPVPEGETAEVGRLMPGKMMLIDTQEGRILYDKEIKGALASAYPYRDWLEKNRIDLMDVSSGRTVDRSVKDAERLKRIFLYSKEDIDRILIPTVQQFKEPVSSAGCDIPLPILSDVPQLFFNYFRQSFAQVTNPAIDPIREELVMSVTGYIGSVHNDILSPTPDNCRIVKVRHPIITNREIDLLKNLKYRGFSTEVIPMTFRISDGPNGLEKAVQEICRKAERSVDDGESYIILSDRSVDKDHAAIPSLLAVSAVHQYLVGKKKRLQAGIIVESGEPREVEHIALLFSYGANLVNPYLAYEQIEELCRSGRIQYDPDTAEYRYIRVLEKGLMKIMSKMGISTIRSYRGSCLFEAVGLDRGMCQKYLSGTVSHMGGIGMAELGREIISRHVSVFSGEPEELPDLGIYTYRAGGERHTWSPETVRLLHAAAADPSEYKAFAEKADLGDGLFFIRDLMEAKKGRPVPLEEVEPESEIVKRFVIEAMSFGAISREAHETMTEAANRLGAKSNCGEGGEDPSRNVPVGGRNIRSAVRQVASGRFGVNTEYLVNAEELQIKCAQGAKPGEGGQLMGFKVDKIIAATRHTLPGVTLISPPPHHDIYSIEDLKQLILDLRCVNPKARISVKLVSEAGVGTVASGVAKAGADKILISGADGGTGAAPMSSMRYAGLPWELGMAEAQQTLVSNGLRGRVVLQVDGQMKTGRDVVMATLLGAEEYGFAASVLVSMGCVMCRKCQTNTCPVGIATQDPEKRARFKGTPENVSNYLMAIARDVRERLAAMGFRSLQEIIGRADLIETRSVSGKASSLDIWPIASVAPGQRTFSEGQPDMLEGILDRRMVEDVMSDAEAGRHVSATYSLDNTDRSVGAMLSGEIQRRGMDLRDGTVEVGFTGTAGQSFGAFLVKGISFSLDGQANDFVGKGLSGGRISIFRSGHSPRCNVLAGNTVMYGATAGELYVAGRVGERFCVRNSGATAVAEGAGDHCCEYMTGGRVVILGRCGRNFAAGMSAGVAYVLDDSGDFDRRCNMDMVELELMEDPSDCEELKQILEKHVRYTGSPLAASLLSDWEESCKRFVKVMPVGYKMLLKDESN